MKVILITIAALLFSSLASAQNTSVYTSTRTSACRTIESTPDEGGSYEGECKGAGGYKVRILEGDIRQTLNIITPGKKKFELDFWRFYSGFSSIGEKIEWRIRRGVPVALIARYNVVNAEDASKSTSYLVISKIGKDASCVTDVVEPGKDQNVNARTAADAASKAPCKNHQ